MQPFGLLGDGAVAWMRMMGADSVAYHQATVMGRADDFPGQALAYYASRGETPLVWGGSGAARLGLVGRVTEAQYAAIYGPGGACDPTTGKRLVRALRPGMEIVVSAHKSVADLGVLGRAEDMHEIMDAERDATLAYLDEVTRTMGGRRGRSRTPAATGGLVYAHARHATSRAGDPCPHDHVLIANVVEMRDRRGGYKAPDTTLWREHLHAATMVGRIAAAVAAELAGAKAVLVGDHRQLGSVGPGGSLQALFARHRPAVHILKENVRQEDPGERAALAHLRAGDVARAVAWYAEHDRIVTAPTRDEALDRVVDAWAADIETGKHAAMYAWRRTNVEELNRRARQHMAATGRLSGPEITAAGGHRYAAVDRIVVLAPGDNGQLVTSERGQVVAADPTTGALTARMDDGRSQTIGPQATGAERLAHGYAVTVQRRQAEAFAQMDGMSWRSRWDWQRSARRWGKEEHAAQGRYDRVAGPELKRLSQELGYLEANRGELTHQLEEREAWLSAHPEAERRLKSLDSQLSSTQPAGTRSLVDEALDRLGHQRQVAPKAPEQDLGLDAGIDFGL